MNQQGRVREEPYGDGNCKMANISYLITVIINADLYTFKTNNSWSDKREMIG